MTVILLSLGSTCCHTGESCYLGNTLVRWTVTNLFRIARINNNVHLEPCIRRLTVLRVAAGIIMIAPRDPHKSTFGPHTFVGIIGRHYCPGDDFFIYRSRLMARQLRSEEHTSELQSL